MQRSNKISIWRGFSSVFGWKASPVLEFIVSDACRNLKITSFPRKRTDTKCREFRGSARWESITRFFSGTCVEWVTALLRHCARTTTVFRSSLFAMRHWKFQFARGWQCALALLLGSAIHAFAQANLAPPAAVPAVAASLPTQQFAELGECVLESGAVIADCKIGYVTLGQLNAERSNAILFPTFYGGVTAPIVAYLGPGKLVDTDKYFVIVVDSFGNGISSSPSNSLKQAGAAFPAMSIRDMVRQQKRMLGQHFKLDRLHAVMGISMGAMQAFEWAVWAPQFAEKFVAIAGSPQLATYDLALWDMHMRLFRLMVDCQCQTPAQLLAGIRFLSNTEANVSMPRAQRDKALGDIANSKADLRVAHDRLLQVGAMTGHDVARNTDGDLQKAAAAVGSKLFVVVGSKDTVVTPAPALNFAKLAGAKTLEISACGHDIPRCQADTINTAVNAFLAR
jgi:homoserine O-acetyltransferase/O-succinyltransferase